jgi:PAS domain S-box-containing protein
MDEPPLLRAFLGETAEGETFRILDRQGKERVASPTLSPVLDAEGVQVGVVGIWHDMTKMERANRELRASEQRWRQLAEAMPQLVWTCTQDGQCDYLSPQWVEFTGIPASEQIGYGWMERVHPDDQAGLKMTWESSIQTEKELDTEFRIRRHDGEYCWFKTRAVPVRDEAGKVIKWYGSNTDINELRLAQDAQRTFAAIEERQRLARELHDSASQTFYSIGLGAHAAVILIERDNDTAAAAEAMRYIIGLTEAGLADMRALIFDLRPDSLEVEGLAAALQKQAAAMRARNMIAVDIDLCQEPETSLHTKEALYRIAQEALHNIARHAHAAHVTIRLSAEKGMLELEVTDDGKGFDTNASRVGHMGLNSMAERAAELGGALQIESEIGHGSRIRTRIPIRPAERAAAAE